MELDADLLGEEQWQWFEEEMKTSTAQIHLIGSGTKGDVTGYIGER